MEGERYNGEGKSKNGSVFPKKDKKSVKAMAVEKIATTVVFVIKNKELDLICTPSIEDSVEVQEINGIFEKFLQDSSGIDDLLENNIYVLYKL
ncbi:hypothetical protein HAX54_001020, partial [Datura stramonium]|nr:hypothetical protein [Datura stramonium]